MTRGIIHAMLHCLCYMVEP